MPGTPSTEFIFFDFDELDALEACNVDSSIEPVDVNRSATVKKDPSFRCVGRRNRSNDEERRHFLTFGNGAYASSAIRIASEVRALDIFHELHAFTELPSEIASDPRWHRHISDGGKGFGWCFWKPVLVNYLLDCNLLEDGDLLVYGDAGCTVPRDSSTAWLQLFNHFAGPKALDFLAFHNDQLENRRTKGDTFAYFGKRWDSEDCGLTCQLVGGYWISRINTRTRKFFAKWESLCADTHLVSDDPSKTLNPRFVENRHDQSLLSMLVKCSVPPPSFVRADALHFNAAARPDDATATTWRENSIGLSRHGRSNDSAGRRTQCQGVEGLSVLIFRDCGWPVTLHPTQPIAATRICGNLMSMMEGSMYCD